MPATYAGIEIGGKPPSTSQPGTAQGKLRRWTANGAGVPGGIQHQVNRLFRTEEEGKIRSRPKVDVIEDVTRDLGLDPTDQRTIEKIIAETRADWGASEKLRYPRVAFARSRLSDYLQKTKRIAPDVRMELRRRAMEWWRKFGHTTYEGKPMIRATVTKAQLESFTLLKADGGQSGGPYIGPRGGKWADPQHTVPYTDIDKYKMRVSGKDHEKVAKQLESGIQKAADICKINPPLCHGNLGVERKDMPQLPDDVVPGFLKTFQDKGVAVTKGTMKVGQLKATQKEINADKVLGMAKAYKEGSYDPSKQPIIVSKDGYVLDGHHRWAAMVHDHPENEMRVYKVDTDIKTLLHAAKNHKGVNYGQGFGAASDIKGKGTGGGEAEDVKEAKKAAPEAMKKPYPKKEMGTFEGKNIGTRPKYNRDAEKEQPAQGHDDHGKLLEEYDRIYKRHYSGDKAPKPASFEYAKRDAENADRQKDTARMNEIIKKVGAKHLSHMHQMVSEHMASKKTQKALRMEAIAASKRDEILRTLRKAV